ncbi:VanZ family protein [Rhodopila sp.]|uniref:VanZ family protein n=1 Tax=Rhodopila sp. TaxID=2480087 RepID=UPI003D140301
MPTRRQRLVAAAQGQDRRLLTPVPAVPPRLGYDRSPDPAMPGQQAVSRIPLLCVVALLILFIIYGSLYPFVFIAHPAAGGPVSYLIGTWRDWDARGDLLSNILLYSPLGFFVIRVLPDRLGAPICGMLTILACTTLSICMEMSQFHDAGRVTSMGDVYANAIGSAFGALTSAALGAGLRWPLVAALAECPNAALLLVMFLGDRLYPYVPMIDMHKYWHAVRGMIQHPVLPPEEVARYAITWLLVAMLVHSVYGFRSWCRLFPLFVLGEFAGRILIVNAVLTWPDVAGAAIALVLWAGLLGRMPSRAVILTVAFGGLVIALRLQPFQFSPVALRGFGWIPFWSLMHGSENVAMQAFCEKFVQYGGMIWLLGRTGTPLPGGTGLTAGMLFLTSYAETYLPDHTAEITDAILAVGIGAAFTLLATVDWARVAGRSGHDGSKAT